MQTYTVKPDSFKAFKKRLLLLNGIVFLSAVMGLVFIFPFRDKIGIIMLVAAMVMVLIIAALALNRTMKRMREVWPTYTLTFGEDYVLKKQLHHSDIKIFKYEIKKIKRTFLGDLVVKTRNWKKFILIPGSLEGLEEVEHLLSHWKPIKTTSIKTLTLSLSLAISIFLCFLILIRYFFLQFIYSHHNPNDLSIQITLLVLVIISFVPLWLVRSMPQVDKRAKPKRWIFILLIGYLILLLISISISLFLKAR